MDLKKYEVMIKSFEAQFHHVQTILTPFLRISPLLFDESQCPFFFERASGAEILNCRQPIKNQKISIIMMYFYIISLMV
jgi:hypothetical protein